jgi:hypothetical protein
MADERYEWLDEKAAERLLRGDVDDVDAEAGTGAGTGTGAGLGLADGASGVSGAPGASGVSGAPGVSGAGRVDRADRVGGPEAERLADALDAVRGRAGLRSGLLAGTGELPGEAAALAAFRQSRAGTARARRHSRWGRPARLGLVTALAAGALGGVAVAAGAGVLPTPFQFGSSGPEPAVSVSAAASPEGEEADGDRPDVQADADPERGKDARDPSADSSPGTVPEDPSVRKDSTGGASGKGRDQSAANGSPDGSGDTSDSGTSSPSDSAASAGDSGSDTAESSGAQDKPSGDWRQRTAKACRDYRADRLPDHLKKYLETQAKGADEVSRFCDRLLGGGGNGTRPDPGPTKGNGDQDDEPGGGGNGNGNGGAPGNGGGNEGSGDGKNDRSFRRGGGTPQHAPTDSRDAARRALLLTPPATTPHPPAPAVYA